MARSRSLHLLVALLFVCLGLGGAAFPRRAAPETGFPPLRCFAPKEYGGDPQNWRVVQDRRGLIYVGNNQGVLEYDSSRWRLIPTQSRTIVRSLAMDEGGRIYVGGQGEIGYLAPDATGRLAFVSLNDLIEPQFRKFADVFTCLATPQGVWFQSREMLFRYAGGRVQAWRPDTILRHIAYVNGRLFVRQQDRGLLEMAGDRLVPVQGGERFLKDGVYVVLPLARGRILFGTRTAGFFTLEGGAFTPFPTEIDAWAKANTLYSGLALDDGTLVLTTLHGGMAFLDQGGRCLGILNKASGIPSDTIYSVAPDAQGGLWVAHEKGIVRVEWPTPITIFDERSGLKGSTYCLHRHQGVLYAGTSQGVSVLEPVADPKSLVPLPRAFRPVEGMKDQVFGLLTVGSRLLAANTHGVFEIKGHSATLLLPTDDTANALCPSRRNPGRIYVGLAAGLTSLLRSGEGWVGEGLVPGITEDVRTIVEAEDGRLWLGTQAQGVLRVTFPAKGPAQVERFGPAQGWTPGSNGSFVSTLEGRPVFETGQGLCSYDEGTKRLVPDARLARLFPAGPRAMSAAVRDAKGRIWMDSYDERASLNEIGVAVPGPDGSFRWEKTPFLRLDDLNFYTIELDTDGSIWFGGPEGLIRYDPGMAKDYRQAYPALVRKLDTLGGRSIFGGVDGAPGARPVLPFRENRIRFELGVPAYDQPENNRYQVFLEGSDEAWSPWTAESHKEYTNLSEGSYRFKVRARNLHGEVSGEGVYAFRILPPWYRTWWAICIWGLLGAVAVFLVVVWRTSTLEREKARLEGLVALRTAELQDATLTDPLTELRNRRFFSDVLSVDLKAFLGQKLHQLRTGDNRKAGDASQQVFGIVLLDIDHFKQVNDTHGHEAGDWVLRQFAAILKKSVRSDDVVMRIGGEEFLVVLKRTSMDYLDAFAARLKGQVEGTPFQLPSGATLQRTCCIGYGSFPFLASAPDRFNAEQIIALVDLGLYYAKEHGRNMSVRISEGPRLAECPDLPHLTESLEGSIQAGYLVMKAFS